MAARASLPLLARAFALALIFAAALTACGKARRESPPPEGEGQRVHAELPADALLTYVSGGGATGSVSRVTLFADGRVQRSELRTPTPPEIRVPVARVQKLAADLATTGVFAQKNGEWAPSKPVADGGGANLVVRDDAGAVHAYEWSAGATAPDAVQRAFKLCDELASEIERAHPRPLCKCVPGDPLCSCL